MILARVGQEAMRLLFSVLAERVTAEAKGDGFRVERRPRIRVEVLFGAIEIESPYVWRTGEGHRPVTERLKVEHATWHPSRRKSVR